MPTHQFFGRYFRSDLPFFIALLKSDRITKRASFPLYVLVPPPLRKGEPLQATVAAVYECYGLACKLTVRDSRAIPRVGEGELPPTDVHDALPGMEGVTEPPKPDSTPRSGLQERSL